MERMNLDKKCTEAEKRRYMHANTAYNNSKQAVDINSISPDVPATTIEAYVRGYLQMMSQAQTEKELWVIEMQKKYNLPDVFNIDFKTNDFFVVV